MRIAVLAAVVALGAGLRLLAVGQDLWLDEIWSLNIAETCRSPLDVFANAFDNNHPLITMAMVLLGDQDSPVPYRLPSLLAGLCALLVAIAIGRRAGPSTAWITGLVFAVSFPMIVYSVEARGYVPAVACALASYALFENGGIPSWRTAALLWVCALIGLLSHLTFLHFYAAFVVWSGYRVLRVLGRSRAALAAMLRLHAVPGLCAAALYGVWAHALYSGGGPDWRYEGVFAESLSWALGLPQALGLWLLAAAAAAVLAWDTARRYHAGDDAWLFFPVITLVPALGTLVTQPLLLVHRYLLHSIVFFLIPVSCALDALWRRQRWLGAAALLVVVAGNLQQVVPFIRDGRGHYAEALRYIAAHNGGGELVIGSDHDVRNPTVLAYHGRKLALADRIVYVPRADRQPQAPRWLLMHAIGQPPAPRPHLVLRSGATYLLRETFPYFGPAGFHWFVYEQLPRGARQRT